MDQARPEVHVNQTMTVSNSVTHHRVPHGGLQCEALRFDFRLPSQHPHAMDSEQKDGGRGKQKEKKMSTESLGIRVRLARVFPSGPMLSDRVGGASSWLLRRPRVSPSPWKLGLDATSGAKCRDSRQAALK